MEVTKLAFVLLLGLGVSEAAINCDHGNSTEIQGNPIGTCACDGHLWVAEGCQEGFFCYDTQANGCHITCEPDEILYTNFANEFWDCRINAPPTIRSLMEGETEKELLAGYDTIIAEGLPDQQALLVCPANGYNLCPSGDVATTPFPPGTETGNPLGECRCDGELWLAEGCKYGYYCDESDPNGGKYLACDDPNDVINIWPTEKTWNCTSQTETCYGGAVLGAGCEKPDCIYSQNPFGPCECEEQFFINDECTEGFWCTSNIPDPFLYDGCYQKCYEGQVLQPDFEGKTWQCVDATEQRLCPGTFKLECEPTGDFDQDDCDCIDGQLHVSGDCKESFYCRSRSVGGGVAIKCEEEGKIVSLDYDNWSWSCQDDKGNCPGLGGFKVGCTDDGNIEPPDLDCNFGVNPLGDCECESQIFINDDCSQSFYCSQHIPADEDPTFNGCMISCTDGERVSYDFENESYGCVPRETDYVCPGTLTLNCPNEEFNPQCQCDNELWINEDCSRGYLCNEENSHNSYSGFFVDCPEGEYFDVDLDNVLDIQCSTDPKVCPGAFHFGCEGEDISNMFPGGGSEPDGASEIAVSFTVMTVGLMLTIFRV